MTADHQPRYVVREQHGTTVGESASTWDFLILDSWYGYREVLWVKPRGGEAVEVLRRRVYAYAALLNEPRVCGCGCGGEVPVRPFRSHGITRQPLYTDTRHRYRAKHKRARDGRVS